MNTIRFTQNWASKLNNEKYFTTLRLSKGFYKVGETVQIELKSKIIGTAKIKTVNVSDIDKLPDLICFMDTGYNQAETQIILKRIYPNENWNIQKIAILLLEWIDKK